MSKKTYIENAAKEEADKKHNEIVRGLREIDEVICTCFFLILVFLLICTLIIASNLSVAAKSCDLKLIP